MGGEGHRFSTIKFTGKKKFRQLFLIPESMNLGGKIIVSTGLGYRAQHTCPAFTYAEWKQLSCCPCIVKEMGQFEDSSV